VLLSFSGFRRVIIALHTHSNTKMRSGMRFVYISQQFAHFHGGWRTPARTPTRNLTPGPSPLNGEGKRDRGLRGEVSSARSASAYTSPSARAIVAVVSVTAKPSASGSSVATAVHFRLLVS